MVKRPTKTQARRGKPTSVSAALSTRQVPQILNMALDRVEEDRRKEAQLEAKGAMVESEMLATDLKRLVEKHGKDHPLVRKVQLARASMERQGQLAEAVVRRIETVQAPERGGWTAAGRVWDESGKPLADVEVGFAISQTDSGKGALEPTTTDADGEFYATYPAETVKALIANKAQLSLLVRKGRTVIYRDETSFMVEPNAIRQFRVRVEKPGKPTGNG